jgi:hypothetical protein
MLILIFDESLSKFFNDAAVECEKGLQMGRFQLQCDQEIGGNNLIITLATLDGYFYFSVIHFNFTKLNRVDASPMFEFRDFKIQAPFRVVDY